MDNYRFEVVNLGSPEYNLLISNPVTKDSLFKILKPDFPEAAVIDLESIIVRAVPYISRFSLCLQNDIVIANAIGCYYRPLEHYYISLVRTIEGCQRLGMCEKVMYNLIYSYWDKSYNEIQRLVGSGGIQLSNAVRLEVLENNSGAIACYTKFGFRRINTLRERSDGSITIIWMELDIDLYKNYFLNFNLKKLVNLTNRRNNGVRDISELTSLGDTRQKIRSFLQ
jgi:hypothetical protein